MTYFLSYIGIPIIMTSSMIFGFYSQYSKDEYSKETSWGKFACIYYLVTFLYIVPQFIYVTYYSGDVRFIDGNYLENIFLGLFLSCASQGPMSIGVLFILLVQKAMNLNIIQYNHLNKILLSASYGFSGYFLQGFIKTLTGDGNFFKILFYLHCLSGYLFLLSFFLFLISIFFAKQNRFEKPEESITAVQNKSD